jgi:radical SAM superfamily enzyme YgiQ (UPF0313 family)
MFVLGGDPDDVDTVRETVRFAIEKQIDTAQFLPLYPLPGTQIIEQLQRENRLFLTLNPQTGRYDLDYGVGNFVLMQTRNINPLTLQRELLKAYERFYSVRNIALSALRGARLESVIARLVGRHLVRLGRQQIHEHLAWMQQHGFTKDWSEFVASAAGRA